MTSSDLLDTSLAIQCRDAGKIILSKTISVITVESEIAKPLEDIQNKFKNIEIGSYPFFRKGKIGV